MLRRANSTLALLLRLALANAAAFLLFALAGWKLGVRDPFPEWFRLSTDLCLFFAILLFLASLPLLARRFSRHNAVLLATISGTTAITVLFLIL